MKENLHLELKLQLQNQHGEEMPRYKMNAVLRGYCIILNNYMFSKDGLEERKGTEVDKNKLRALFEKLHFMVRVFNNFSGERMKEILDFYAAKDHIAHDCVVVILMSHGRLGEVYGVDGDKAKLDDLKAPFKPEMCQSLKNKPKIFIVQACRGDGHQPSVPYHSQQAGAPESFPESDSPESDSPDVRSLPASPSATVPNEADFLVAYATVPGYKAYRDRNTGSWFVTKFVEVMEQYHKHYDLLSILTQVNKEIGDEYEYINRDGPSYKQTINIDHTLRKAVFFPVET